MSDVRVGIIGAGMISRLHALGYENHPEAEIYAVCDVREETARRRQEEWGAHKAYTDYRELLADDAVDAVEIIVPHRLHRQMTVDALGAGKHVSLQKPMAMNMAECRDIIAASEQADALCRIYENFRFYPAHIRAKELIDAGEIGEPLSIRFKLTNGYTPDSVWTDPDPGPSWRGDWAASGGGAVTFDHGYHVYSMAEWLMGEVEEVFAWIDFTPDEAGHILDSPAMISWKYAGRDRYGVWEQVWGSDLLIKSSYYAGDDRMEITGEKGIIWVNKCCADFLDVPPLVVYRDGKVTEHHDLDPDWGASFRLCTMNYIDSILGRAEPEIGVHEAARIMQFTIAVKESAQRHQPVRVDAIQD